MARPILISADDAPVPAGADVRVLVTPDNVELRAAVWAEPAAGVPARGTVLLLHGRTEFIEKYHETIEDLRGRGYAVVTFDWRGQGLSSRMLTNPRKGFVGSFDDFVRDAGQVMDTLLAPLPKPHMLMAHSMGGNVALRLLAERPDAFERAVLSAPMTGLIVPGILRFGAMLADWLGLGTAFPPGQDKTDPTAEDFTGNVVTSDEARFLRARKVLAAEDGLILGGITWRWLREAFRSIDMIHSARLLDRIKTPVLIVSAGQEALVSPDSHTKLAERCGRIRCVRIDEALHEVIQERDELRGRWWRYFDRFVDDPQADLVD